MHFKRFAFAILFILFSSLIFSQENEKEKKEKEVDDEFYSIQSNSLTACNGDVWFLQEYDDFGKITLSVLYNKDKLIEKREYFYTDDYKSGLNIYLSDKVIKIKYNKNGYELEKAVYDKDAKVIKEKTINEYDKNNLLLKTSLEKDDKNFVSVFTYNSKKLKKTQTDFINKEKVCFIEFTKTKRIVHLFQFGKEIRVLEEEY